MNSDVYKEAYFKQFVQLCRTMEFLEQLQQNANGSEAWLTSIQQQIDQIK